MEDKILDLVRFYKQKYLHIVRTGTVPGHRKKALCGDIGQTSETGLINEKLIQNKRLCRECREEYLRSRPAQEYERENMAAVLMGIFPPMWRKDEEPD